MMKNYYKKLNYKLYKFIFSMKDLDHAILRIRFSLAVIRGFLSTKIYLEYTHSSSDNEKLLKIEKLFPLNSNRLGGK